MEIVIKLDENVYEFVKHVEKLLGSINKEDDTVETALMKAIINGTPLPKGHGRLIDADALVDSLDASDRDIYCKAVIEEDAPTIIEGSESR